MGQQSFALGLVRKKLYKQAWLYARAEAPASRSSFLINLSEGLDRVKSVGVVVNRAVKIISILKWGNAGGVGFRVQPR